MIGASVAGRWLGVAGALGVLGAAVAGSMQQRGEDVLVIRAGAVHVGDGRVIERGLVVVRGGRIVAVGADVPIPEGATVIDARRGSVTPGLIDANALIEPTDEITAGNERAARAEDRPSLLARVIGMDAHSAPMACDGRPVCPLAAELPHTAETERMCPICGGAAEGGAFVSGLAPRSSHTEASSEVVPHTRVLDSIDLLSPDFERLVRGGVTTVFVSPDSAAVIGPRGAVVRTAGPIEERVISPAADVKAALSSDTFSVGARNSSPSRFGVSVRTRRPQSRMGVVWVFRKALYDAERLAAGAPVVGADTASPAALRVVGQIREGSVPLRVLARTERDIAVAARLKEEFGLTFVLVEPIEAYKCMDQVRALGCPVVFGPIFVDPSGARMFSDESSDSRLTTIRLLREAGVTAALSAQDLREEDGLARQAMYAVRAGLGTGEALSSVTSVPASMLGLGEEIGTVEVGKRADLVVWSGEALAAASRPIVTISGGRIVFDGRERR